MDSSPSTAAPDDYQVASDLSKLCLPQEYLDANRRLAWVNSVCCLFLLIGVVGFKAPSVHVRPLSEVVEIMPAEIITPEEPPPQTPTEQPPDEQPTDVVTPDTPVVATVVAANPERAVFPVAVEGPVVLVPINRAPPPPATPPPAVRPPPSSPTRYVPSVGDWGGHPAPDYPGIAIRMRYQGTVTLLITVDPSGTVSNVEVQKSTGYKVLDEAALDHVRKHLRLRNPPGEVRRHMLDIVFQLQR